MKALLLLTALALPAPALADDLYASGNWSSMSADRRASAVGDAITVVINQVSEASNVAQNVSRKSSTLSGSIDAGPVTESGDVGITNGYSGRGEVRRSERLIAQLTVVIEQVLANGDFVIVGRQNVQVNGERSNIAVRGRIRAADINSHNQVVSTRIADATIDYDGKGFVSRSARPGLLSKLFSLFGLL